MRTPITFTAILTLLTPLFLTGQEAPSGGPVTLRPQFYSGKIYNYVTDTAVTMQPAARPGQPASAARRVTMEHHARLKVGDRTETGGVSIQASTDQLKMQVAAGDKKIVYDSKNSGESESAEARLLSRHFDGATKRTLALELDGDGKVIKAVEQGGGGSATPLPGLPEFGPGELKRLVAGMVQGFPSDPVIPGEEWVQKGKRSLGQFGEIDFEITYRYTGDEEFEGTPCARIDYSGEIKGDVAVSGSVTGKASGKLGFEGTELKGRLMFDKVRKAVRFSEQKVNMQIEAPSTGSSTGTVRLPMRQTVTSRLVSLQDA